jgi:diacylglycerol kinase family enzyme
MTISGSRIAVVVNGNAKSVTEEVISTIDKILKGGDLFVSRHISEAPKIARTIVDGDYGTVLTGGGDGTFTVTVTEVMKAAYRAHKPAPRFGLLKLGTGNALAWVVGPSDLGRKGVSVDMDRLLSEAGSKEIHLVNVEGFLSPFAGLGADAQILADYNATKEGLAGTPLERLGRGLSGYGLAAVTRSLPAFLIKPSTHITVVNEGDDAFAVDPRGVRSEHPLPKGSVLYSGKLRMAALSTIPYYGFGMRLFPFAMARPGLMNLRLSKVGSPQFLAHFRGIWNGTYHDPQYLSDFLVDKVSLHCDPAVEFQIGGDPHGTRQHVVASVTKEPIELVDYYESNSEP